MENSSNGAQHFLARILEFEKMYEMESWKFQFLYENHRKELPGYNGRAAVDYSEWAFLYENLSHADLTSCESPPWVVNNTDQQRPEELSGFCFSGDKRDKFSSPIFRPCCEHSLGQAK